MMAEMTGPRSTQTAGQTAGKAVALTANPALQRLGWASLSCAIVFVIWELSGRYGFGPAFPPASAVLRAFVEMLASGEFTAAYARTLPPLLIGLAITVFGGVVVGLMVGLSRVFEWFTMPLLVILQTAPVAAIIPLLTYIYGVDDRSKVVAVVILGMPLVALNAYKGIQATPQSLIAMARSFLASRLATVWFVILPSASGMIFAGLRLGVSGAFVGIVLAELLITPTGIGDLITFNRSIARYDKMFAAIVSIIALAGITIAIIQSFETRLFRMERRR